MAVPQFTDDMPNYCIVRDVQPGDAFDPTASLLFFPPKGSDELFDALRLSFPQLKTHSERMREAVIQFLHEEQLQHSLQTSPAMTMDNSWPAPSVLSSPETNNLSTPTSFAPSPQLHSLALTRQASTATNSSRPSPPALDQMTSVFSLSTVDQPKQRIRRKMTEAEKIEYRKRRIVKACEKCAKRKRKCPHNQAEMETIKASSSKSTARVSKPISPNTSKSPPATQQRSVLDPLILTDEDVDFASSFDFSHHLPTEDFSLFQDQDPFAELDMSGFTSTYQYNNADNFQTGNLLTPDDSPMLQDWEYNDLQNLTLPNQHVADQHYFDQGTQHSSPAFYSSSGSLGRQVLIQSDRNIAIDLQPIDSMFSSLDSLQHFGSGLDISQFGSSSSSSDIQQERNADSWTADQLGRTHQTNVHGQGLTFGGLSSQGMNGTNGSGREILWEHLRTPQLEKPVPTHTSHVHDAGSQQLSGLDKGIDDSQQSGQMQRTQQQATGDGIEGHRPLSSTSSLYDVNKRESRIPQTDVIWQEQGSQSKLGSSRSEQDLAFTSVPASGSFKAAAPQEGRSISSSDERNVARQAIQPPASRHQHQNQHQDPSLGHGLPENADPAMQLYMARKRVSSSLSTLVGRNMNAGSPGVATNAQLQTRATTQTDGHAPSSALLRQQTASPANGGAYPRLEQSASSPALSSALAPVHTRPRNPTAANSSGNTRVATEQLNDTGHYQDRLGSQDVEQERLRDTNRHKDHHGRNASLSSYLLAMFGCVLLLHAASLLSNTLSSTALLLALVIPYSQAPEHSSAPKIVRCTTKNSRWLSSAFASLTETKFGLAIPSREKQGWHFPGTEGEWLKGLVYPSAIAPMRSVRC